MTDSNKKNSTEDIMASLLAELKLAEGEVLLSENQDEFLDLGEVSSPSITVEEVEDQSDLGLLDLNIGNNSSELEKKLDSPDAFEIKLAEGPHSQFHSLSPDSEDHSKTIDQVNEQFSRLQSSDSSESQESHFSNKTTELPNTELNSEKTVAIATTQLTGSGYGEGERTVAVAGFSNRNSHSGDENIKISVGQTSGGHQSGYGGWGSTDSNLAQAENLKIAQSKILELEKENEKLRHQNEELVSASEIIKERSDLLTAQVYEYKNDREALESSFKNEMALIKSQLNRKDAELQKAQMKIDELDSRLKFDMKKIRIRERELENRLELIRAEKNALVRSKDEQILESRRKLDQLQLEVDSYRQKCVELNRVIETNQDSFKRTTRALRLAMANLELQEENKMPLKKVD